MAGIYIHIPFCRQACYYCDFHFSVNQDVKPQLIKAIAKELTLQKDYLQGEAIDTIYLGGGTPSLLTAVELSLLFGTIRSHYSVSPHAEITLEANPDDLTREKLSQLKSIGLNRLSIGIQTFNTERLKSLNRIHDEASAIRSFNDAREAGFDNITIDLMYALPGETMDDWRRDIAQAINLHPEHISCYSLTIEPKTVFGKWAATGKLNLQSDEVAARHLEMLMEMLPAAGYEHYEISNFAKPGFHSKHNSSYWRGVNYLGVGPSAHSFNGESRQYNITNNHLYLKALNSDAIPFEKEILSRENRINEYILTSLRTSWGTDLSFLKQTYGYDLLTENKNYLSELLEKQFVTFDDGVLKLTKAGKLFADKISSDLFLT
ncbi:MAG TPA: radical SAM family heme chaperone HemW [Cyclobacteriaceae bacterium]|nr:radical SAM family heme chaperone HemW [Cyclobacteriaceae bacterium]HMV07650.1 radical SAM family heme chaperone HemW [Cyclobacteriaceae bacterium]HMV88451.1 radical SAM family heme chaperone HemW [Cyclobacteriaceae bacterium]HMW98785.1 radical SAM family heme chaperone HemW [Cyclobacteriaceae bacterium]HMX48582.1 radical SAM family heme chaperone HemW [Cyclobacteriaceae bacterium]